MRTGTTRKCHRPALLFVAFFAVFALVTLAGCDDNSPVAAPTSTVPEPQPSSGSADDAAEVAIPEYETDLDLTDKEKEAVDGALVAFVGYIDTINRVFSSGGTDLADIEVYASSDSLRSLQQNANDLKDDDKYMAGEYDFYNVRIQTVSLNSQSSKNDSIEILFCSHDSKHAVVDAGQPMPSQPDTDLTILQTATKHETNWKISNQELWSEKCE